LSDPWLVLDCNLLCYRAHFSTGQLSFDNNPTGVIYGFLRDINVLQTIHATKKIAFCFDKGKPKRKEILRTYKQGRRKERTPEEIETFNELGIQINQLRDEILPEIGFRNVFGQSGYCIKPCFLSLIVTLFL